MVIDFQVIPRSRTGDGAELLGSFFLVLGGMVNALAVKTFARYANGVMYQKNSRWVHVNGFSENAVRFISVLENEKGEAG